MKRRIPALRRFEANPLFAANWNHFSRPGPRHRQHVLVCSLVSLILIGFPAFLSQSARNDGRDEPIPFLLMAAGLCFAQAGAWAWMRKWRDVRNLPELAVVPLTAKEILDAWIAIRARLLVTMAGGAATFALFAGWTLLATQFKVSTALAILLLVVLPLLARRPLANLFLMSVCMQLVNQCTAWAAQGSGKARFHGFLLRRGLVEFLRVAVVLILIWPAAAVLLDALRGGWPIGLRAALLLLAAAATFFALRRLAVVRALKYEATLRALEVFLPVLISHQHGGELEVEDLERLHRTARVPLRRLFWGPLPKMPPE